MFLTAYLFWGAVSSFHNPLFLDIKCEKKKCFYVDKQLPTDLLCLPRVVALSSFDV